MLPSTVYTVEESFETGPFYRIERDGEPAYRVSGITGRADFETPAGEPAFTVESWGLSDPRYGYVVRDADGEDLGWIADDVPFVGRRYAIKSMDDETIATLGDAGWTGKLLYELTEELALPFPGPTRLALRTPEGHPFGRAERSAGSRTYRLGLEDVGFEERLALAALVVLNTGDQWDRTIAIRDRLDG